MASIILLEDPFIRSYLRFVLSRRGHTVVECPSFRVCEMAASIEGVVVVTNQPEVFLSCADRIALIYLATAPDMELVRNFPKKLVLRKPFQPDELLKAVETVTAPS